MPIYLNVDDCIGCNSCVLACENDALIMLNGKPILTPDSCVLCGHCFAICPTGCFSLLGYKSQDYNGDLTNIVDAIVMRRSIRYYKEDKVDQDLLFKVVNISRYAPSASNKRSLRFLVVGKTTMTTLLPLIVNALNLNSKDNMYQVFRNAPHFIITYEEKTVEQSSEEESAIWLTQIELYAQQFGLGTFWAGLAQKGLQKSGAEFLGISGFQIRSCMGIGYPNIKFIRPAARNYVENVIWVD